MLGADCRRFGAADAGLRINVVCWGDLLTLRDRSPVEAGLLANAVGQASIHASAIPHSRASALLQLIQATRETIGVRKICRSGQHRGPSADAKSVDPATFGVRKICRSGATPATSGVRKICRSRLAGESGVSGIGHASAIPHSRASALLQLIRAQPATFGDAKSVGAGLLANAVYQIRRGA